MWRGGEEEEEGIEERGMERLGQGCQLAARKEG